MCSVDETPTNCQMFIDSDGLNIFLACFNVSLTCHLAVPCLLSDNLCYTIQMMHGSEWTLKYGEPEVQNVAHGSSPSATFQSMVIKFQCCTNGRASYVLSYDKTYEA